METQTTAPVPEGPRRLGLFAKIRRWDPGRTAALRVVAVLGCLWVVISAVPHLVVVNVSRPRETDIVTDYDGRIRAGPGTEKKVDFRSIPFEERYRFTPSRPPLPGDESYEIPLVPSGSLTTYTSTYFDSERLSVNLRAVAAIGFVIVAGIALWRVPTRRGFSFFLFVVGANPIALNARLSQFPSATPWLFDTIISDLLTSIAFLGIVDFAVHGEHREAFAALWDRALPVFAPLYCTVNTWPDIGALAYGLPSEFINRIGFAAQACITVYGGIALVVAAMRSARHLRNPLIVHVFAYWIGVGGYVVAYVLLFSSVFRPLPDNVTNALQSSAVLLFFSIIVGSTIIRRLAMLRTKLQRLISIGLVVQLLVTATWFTIIRWLEAFGHSETPLRFWIFAVLEIAGSVLLERTASHSVEARLAAEREARRRALEATHEDLDAAQTEAELDGALLNIAQKLYLELIAVYKKTDAMFSAVAMQGCTRAALPVISDTDSIVQRLQRSREIKLAAGNVFGSTGLAMAYCFRLRRRNELFAFVATSAHQDGRPLDDLDVLSVKYFLLRAEMNYDKFADRSQAAAQAGV